MKVMKYVLPEVKCGFNARVIALGAVQLHVCEVIIEIFVSGEIRIRDYFFIDKALRQSRIYGGLFYEDLSLFNEYFEILDVPTRRVLIEKTGFCL